MPGGIGQLSRPVGRGEAIQALLILLELGHPLTHDPMLSGIVFLSTMSFLLGPRS